MNNSNIRNFVESTYLDSVANPHWQQKDIASQVSMQLTIDRIYINPSNTFNLWLFL